MKKVGSFRVVLGSCILVCCLVYGVLVVYFDVSGGMRRSGGERRERMGEIIGLLCRAVLDYIAIHRFHGRNLKCTARTSFITSISSHHECLLSLPIHPSPDPISSKNQARICPPDSQEQDQLHQLDNKSKQRKGGIVPS